MGSTLTEGRPLTILLKFMLPLFIGNVFQQFYNMVDTIIVGKFVGANALAAVGSTGTIMFLVLGISNGMATGFTVLTSQKYGAKQFEGKCCERHPPVSDCDRLHDGAESHIHASDTKAYEHSGGYL